MRRLSPALLLLATSLLLPGLLVPGLLLPRPAHAQAELTRLDRAVAVVGERVVTSSEVQIALALARRDPAGVPALAPDLSRQEQWWIEQVMIRQLAGDVQVYQPSAAELRDRVDRLLAAFEDGIALAELQQRYGLDRDGIEAWVYNRLVVERFVLRNVGALSRDGEVTELSPDRYQAWLETVRNGVAMRRILPVERRP